MSGPDDEMMREAVRKRYGSIARSEEPGCGCSSSSCCGGSPGPASELHWDGSARMGYSKEELESAPEGANLGLGCGNPHAFASLKRGETVLDLGSGGGFDCFIASHRVGPEGHVIGVDMTPDMITKARRNAKSGGFTKVEFRLGEIEHLPVADGTIDVIISNCVINLSTDKQSVFNEAFRVLRPGGRLAVSDVVATAELPEGIKNDLVLYSSCAGGAEPVRKLEMMLKKSGFEEVRIMPKDDSREFIREWAPGSRIEDFIVSATIEAMKPL